MAEDKMHYDAIVVGLDLWRLGSKELTEKGLKVLMLERGRNVEHITDHTTTNMDPWEFPHRGNQQPRKRTATLYCAEIIL